MAAAAVPPTQRAGAGWPPRGPFSTEAVADREVIGLACRLAHLARLETASTPCWANSRSRRDQDELPGLLARRVCPAPAFPFPRLARAALLSLALISTSGRALRARLAGTR